MSTRQSEAAHSPCRNRVNVPKFPTEEWAFPGSYPPASIADDDLFGADDDGNALVSSANDIGVSIAIAL